MLEDIQKRFYYVFGNSDYPGLPQIELIEIQQNIPVLLKSDTILPLRIRHGKLDILGFKIKEFVYITDAKTISDSVIENIRGCQILVLNALRNQTHHSHLSLDQAQEIIKKVKPQKTYLTHISHQLGLHDEMENSLSSNVHLAYDGLQLDC